ncbi:MAG: transposase [Chromatiales bacterium]|nr:transposase [Chromatiales bacterium]
MSRRRRVHIPGGHHHVTLRGNHRQAIFHDPADRSVLDAIVRGACERTGVQVLAYCWMTNHIHLVAQVDRQPLGDLMQIIGSRYARYLQRRGGTTGHLFERRYHAVTVTRQDHLLHVVRYVHLNPVRAGLVVTPGDYLWSSHRCYLGQTELPWVYPATVLRALAPAWPEARHAFARFCGEALSDPNCMATARNLLSAPPVRDSQVAERPLRSGRSLDEIIVAVCCRAGVAEQHLAAPGKSHMLSALRTEIAILATDEGVASLTDVARRFNRDLSSIARAATRRRRTQGSRNAQMPNPVPLKV